MFLRQKSVINRKSEYRTSGGAAGRGPGERGWDCGSKTHNALPGSPLCLLSWRNKKVGSCCGARHLRRRQAPSSSVDRCHSLSSLHLPPAALASLPPGRGLFAAAMCTISQFCSVLVFIRKDTPPVTAIAAPAPSKRGPRAYGIRGRLHHGHSLRSPRRFAPRNDSNINHPLPSCEKAEIFLR